MLHEPHSAEDVEELEVGAAETNGDFAFLCAALQEPIY